MKRLSLVLLAGCSSGVRADVPTTPAPASAHLTQIQLVAANDAKAICPGAAFQLIVTAADTTGRRLATPTSYRRGQIRYENHGLPWQRFRLTASVGSITPAAIFTAPLNIFTLAETADVEVTAQDLVQPSLTSTLRVPVDFRCEQLFTLRGDPGAFGQTGSVGGDGFAGGQVQVSVGRLNTRAHGALILARVDSLLGPRYYLLQPGGAALVVDLSGGEGGEGGEGVMTTSYQRQPGPGGGGGAGGMASIRIDGSDPLLARAVIVYNPGGRGGAGGTNRGGGMHAADGQDGPAGPLPAVSYEDPALLFRDEIAQGFPIAVPHAAARTL